jgi:peptide/nickel transport system substrate-binding protein
MPNFKIPGKLEINRALSSFSKKEWGVFIGFVLVLLLSTLSMLESVNKSFMVEVPKREGSISEGIVGVPRFVNPVLASSPADESLVALIYSGLMRKNTDDTIIPDLASNYDISKNGLVYTFTLKDNLYFQDGTPLTSNDVVFTINKVKDGVVKSPNKINWDGVSVLALNDKTVQFTLKQPYSSFLENATLGIMPSHIWDGSPIELNNANINPVGSGPYMINKVSKQSSGIIDSYELKSFKKFTLGEPYIQNLILRFYQNEDDMINALLDKKLDQISSITPLDAENLKERNYQIESAVLPRVFGLFFNQNQNQLFTDKAIVKAIDQAIDKDKIVKDVLLGYGVAIDSPIPPNMTEYQKLTNAVPVSRPELIQKIQNSLAKDGWKVNADGFLEKTIKDKKQTKTTILEFSISTSNIGELAKAAELIKQDLLEIGMKVDVKTFDSGNLNQNVIRPRKYDALLFGEIINQESDLFAFWDSSQRKDPGLNVAMYTNAKVDKILEDAFITIDAQTRIKKYKEFEDAIRADMPAVFLYSPDFTYVVSKDLKQFKMNNIISPANRYLNVAKWYTKTENVWKIFAR